MQLYKAGIEDKMQICIVGWYYFNDCLIPFSKLTDVHIVAHRPGNHLGIPTVLIDNIGLEFHCYDYFVKNIWDKKSDVMFCHDDIRIKDPSFIDDVKAVEGNMIMIWHSEVQKRQNYAHGRMFKCSSNYLNDNGGFWYDENNLGNISQAGGCNKAIGKLYKEKRGVITHFISDKIAMGSRGKLIGSTRT
jgi:hypothetical protein